MKFKPTQAKTKYISLRYLEQLAKAGIYSQRSVARLIAAHDEKIVPVKVPKKNGEAGK